jgi:hypothetical protein
MKKLFTGRRRELDHIASDGYGPCVSRRCDIEGEVVGESSFFISPCLEIPSSISSTTGSRLYLCNRMGLPTSIFSAIAFHCCIRTIIR